MAMEPESEIEDRLRSLLVRALDGDATSAELKELNDLLLRNPVLCKCAARFICDDSYLAGAIKSIDQTARFSMALPLNVVNGGAVEQALGFKQALQDVAPQDTPAHPAFTGPERPASVHGPRAVALAVVQLVNRHGLLVAATAAALMLALAWQYVAMKAEFERLHSIAMRPTEGIRNKAQNGARTGTSDAGASTVARVTGLVNCAWPDGATPLKFGDSLAPGQRLKLEKGLMQVTFGTGAKVVLEGPSDFTVTTPGQATLALGRIAAAVPRFARGYTILTPTAEIVDLGTEFGVDVDGAGRSEVHVFEGDVVARPRGGVDSHSRLIQAREDEAVEFRAPTEKGRRIPADRSKFVRRLTPGVAEEKLPPLPVAKNLVLWLAADLIVESQEHAPISTWSDILVGDNRFSDDALQFVEQLCPTWVRDRQGRPAVRFDGWSTHLATGPMATGDRVTAFVVFAPSPVSFASDFHGGMLLKFGADVPSLEFSVMPDRAPKARVWSRADDGTKSYVGEVRGQAVEPLKTSAAVYTYDAEHDRAELQVNGKSLGVTSAPRPLEQHARKYIGAHAELWWQAYFSGNIYEIIVYDTALNTTERDLVLKYLSDRYGISPDE